MCRPRSQQEKRGSKINLRQPAKATQIMWVKPTWDRRKYCWLYLLECMALNERESELFKGGFWKLFKLEWNSLQETRLEIQLAKKQSTKPQSTKKTIDCYNRLFIPAKQQQMKLNEFKRRKRYTNSLYRFTLKPRATSSPHNPLGNPLSNQLQITHKTTKEVTLIPSRNTLPLTQYTPRMLILTTSRAHNPSWFYNTKIYKVFKMNYTCYWI